MKPTIAILAILAAVATAHAEIVDCYAFSMTLRVPRIYDNMESLGYRAYQMQRITGEMRITYDESGKGWPVISIPKLTNKTHKIGGKNITYDCTIRDDQVMTRVNLCGSNKTDTFRRASVNIYLDAEPSYSIGPDDEDNSLLLTLAADGSTALRDGVRVINYLQGRAAGTLGCGCKAYGHISPTRVAGPYGATGIVDDVASVSGSWTAKWKSRTTETDL